MTTTTDYHIIPPALMNNRVELSRLLDGFGLALMQAIDGTESDVSVTLTSEGAIVLATALFEVVNQMRHPNGVKPS
jgi:hypothetical protein